jgi:hypothetical protein
MRKGRAKATTSCMKPSPPMAMPTPSVECIMTTKMMQMPLAASTQLTRSSAPPDPFVPIPSSPARDRSDEDLGAVGPEKD